MSVDSAQPRPNYTTLADIGSCRPVDAINALQATRTLSVPIGLLKASWRLSVIIDSATRPTTSTDCRHFIAKHEFPDFQA